MAQFLKKLAPLAVVAATGDKCDVGDKQDCGFMGVDQTTCESKGCCWKPAGEGSAVPWCFFGAGSGPAPGPAPGPSACSLKYDTTGAPFDDAEVEKIRGFYLANIDIQGSGAVVAAPDHNTGPGGDYFFHWERDGALSMDALMRTSKLADIDEKMQHYVQWVMKVQNQPDPHGIDVRTEPKYTIPDGKPFPGSWCRPQNDGPGLRGRTLAEYGLALLKEKKQDYVKQYIYTGDANQLNGGLVKHDLDWVAENWRSNGCDLWEEVQSDDFFWNRYVDRASLVMGAELADKMGDSATATKYKGVAGDIEKTLMGHFQNGFVFESQGRRKDAAVIEAFNTGDLGDGLFAPLSKEVLGTVIVLNDLFCNSFDINKKDNAAGIPGILYGRYEGDNYNGGNPWVLLTATFAQLIYRQAADVAKLSSVDADIYGLLQKAYGIDAGLSGKALGDALLGAGDGVLLRIKHHVKETDLHMAEQISRSDGHMTSAKDLTWNYADILKATHARRVYVASTTKLSASSIIV